MEEKADHIFGNNFVINNDQGLEEEELEDRKRRQAEIHNLLTQAMGNCSLTDDSSINSSSHTAIETISDAPVLTTDDMEKQYLEANIDEQFKVLYEIRCREVQDLSEQLQKVKAELLQHQQISKTKVALVELENERKNISLQEAQNLIADKTDQINQLNKQLENLKYMVTCLEGNLAEVNSEKDIIHQLNLDLEQQIHLLEINPLMNKSSDRELRDSLNNKIKQLEQSLESALHQNELRVKQHSELVRELKQSIQEKDTYLSEKCFLINKLTENFETAQSQCHELIKTVTELREAQNKPKEFVIQMSPLETELHKIRENKERAELCEEVKKVVTEEFQSQISTLITENNILNERLYAKDKQLNDAIQRGEIISIIENEKAVLQNKLSILEEKLQSTVEENKKHHEKLSELTASNFGNVDTALQTSFPHVNTNEFEDLKIDKQKLLQKIDAAQTHIRELETNFAQLQDEHSRLKVTADLERERDTLIKDLQEKAINFEKIILEKQQHYFKQQSERASIGINTTQHAETDREAVLRCELQNEFELKLQNIITKFKEQYSQLQSCKNCEKFKEEIMNATEERKQDRAAVLKLIDVWQNRFQEAEVMSDEKYNNYLSSVDQEYSGRFRILAQMLQEQFLKEIKEQEAKFNQTKSRLNVRINDGINKIVSKIKQGDIEVDQIKQDLKHEQKIKKKKNF